MESNSTSMYLCIHVIQVAPVSCINRDDTGTPKTCMYGGTSRMRVSSQCWKRAVRMYLKERYGDSGFRTKIITNVLSEKFVTEEVCNDQQAMKFVKNWLRVAKIISEKENAKDTSAFFSEEQINALYDLLKKRFLLEKKKDKTESEDKFKSRLIEAVKDKPSTSELLFGRMFASNQKLNYDAACQVAHSFSVNEVYEEPDYFTVVGDREQDRSDYLDTKLFNSGVLYRFADINLSKGSELRNMEYNVDAAKAASQFLEAFVLSMPTGSINAYANMTLPENVVVELRDDVPVSFAPAFAKAIDGKNICQDAMHEMSQYEEKISRLYGSPVRKWSLGEVSLKDLCAQVEEEINRRL